MISAANDRCKRWFEHRNGGPIGPSAGVTVWRNRRRRAVLLWTPDNDLENTVELSVRADGPWMSNHSVLALGAIPFVSLRAKAFVARVSIDNEKTRNVLRRLGAEEYVMSSINTAYFVLHKDNWRWAL